MSEVLGLQALPAGQQGGMGSTLVQSQAFLLLGRLALQLNTKNLKARTCAGGKVRIIHHLSTFVCGTHMQVDAIISDPLAIG